MCDRCSPSWIRCVTRRRRGATTSDARHRIPTYDIEDRLAEGLQQNTGMRTAPLRAIGVGQNAFANEVFLDEIAEKLGLDPVSSGCGI